MYIGYCEECNIYEYAYCMFLINIKSFLLYKDNIIFKENNVNGKNVENIYKCKLLNKISKMITCVIYLLIILI